MKSKIVLLITLSWCYCPAFAAQETPVEISTASDDGEQVIEEITVIGQRTIMNLRVEVNRAVDRMYAIYNDINTDDDFDIHCRWEAPTGSRIRRKLCTPVYYSRVESEATQYALYDLGNSGMTSIYVDYTEMAGNDAKLRENMKRQRRAYWGLEDD